MENNEYTGNKSLLNIGRRFRGFRELLQATPGQMAKKLNKKTDYIQAVENGDREPAPDDLFYLAKKFSLNLGWLLTGSGPIFIPKLFDTLTESTGKKENRKAGLTQTESKSHG